jgi:signal transduction histidine kinase
MTWRIAFLMFAALCVSAEARATVEMKTILVIHPYEPEPTLLNTFDQALSSTLASNPKIALRFYSEYLDLMHFPAEPHLGQLADYFRVKYADRKIDLIISVGVALEFLLKHGEQVFPGTPIVFSSLANQRLKHYTLRPNVTGLAMNIDYRGTLNMILALQPDTRRVVVVSGTSAGDRFWISEAQKEFQNYQDKLTFSFITELSMGDLLDQMRNLPARTVVFYDQMSRDATGRYLLSSEALALICRSSSVPVYSIWKSYVGLGIVGGYVWDYGAEGAAVGRLGLRILTGEKPQDIPVRTLDTNHFVADQMQLRHWRISERNLPPGSIVQNKEPFRQTIWFWVLSLGCATLLGWAGYQWRLRQMTARLDLQFEARLRERERIARELHDSFLQGFQGLMFCLQGVRDLIPVRPTEAIQALDSALDRGDQSIAEGRGTVEDLRYSTVLSNDIVKALTALGEELAPHKENHAAAALRVIAEGKPRDLDPTVRDEVYRIAREALRNAFRHAQAHSIEAEIKYGVSQFLLRIRDDGDGIDPKVLDQGSRAGHWGLPGMRERAKRFGGQLEVWSEHGAGTEVELSIPASVAYGTSFALRFWFLRNKNSGTHGYHS